MSEKILKIFLFFVTIMLIIPISSGNLLISGEKGDGIRAPVNPEFLSYLEKIYPERINPEDEHSLGYIPSPVDLSHNRGLYITNLTALHQAGVATSQRLESLQQGTLVGISGSFPSGVSASFGNDSDLTLSAMKSAGERAPINSEFLQYFEKIRSGETESGDDHALGYIPSPVDLSHNKGKRITSVDIRKGAGSRLDSLPTSYLVTASASPASGITSSGGQGLDLRTTSKVSSVKNQEQCGSCWAFSTYASMESVLLPGESWDFSENNMKNTHGYDFSPCKGGNSIMSTAYLTRWDGPVTESVDPYGSYSSSSPNNVQEVKHVQEVWFLPSRSDPLDNENIKRALMEKGAVYSTIYWKESYYSGYYGTYYYGGSSFPNHAVTIIGWDDSYERTNFERLPSGNGAFIVKNSWGPEWGDDGYFYVSYYDTRIGMDNAVFMAEDPENFQNIYQYDPLGWVVSYGTGSDTAYFANIFTSSGTEYLSAVSFYTAVPDAPYQVSVYLDTHQDPVSGSSATTLSGTIPQPGYHTIRLTDPVRLKAGQRFSVVVKLTTPGYNYPVAMEYPYSGFSSRASAQPGESYVSSNGNTWTDITRTYDDTNVCLKAFTTGTGVIQTVIPTPTPTYTPTPTPTPSVTPTPSPTPAQDTISPAISLTSPRTYTTATQGSDMTIQWSASDNAGIDRVFIEYSTNGKKTWIMVADNLQKSGSYVWNIPPTAPSGIAYVKATAIDTSGNAGSVIKSIIIRTHLTTRNTYSSALAKMQSESSANESAESDGIHNNGNENSPAARILTLPGAPAVMSQWAVTADSIEGKPVGSGSTLITPDENSPAARILTLPGAPAVMSQWKEE